jgi:hypothetical protein
VGKSKTTKTRPGYVPKEGVFFDIKPQIHKSTIWVNGKPLQGVTKAKIIIDPSTHLTKAHLELVLFEGRVSVDDAKMTKRTPAGAPWGVTEEEEEEPIEKEELKESKSKATQFPTFTGTTAHDIRSQIEHLELCGILPFQKVTVAENMVHLGQIDVWATVGLKESEHLLKQGVNPTERLESYVATILPVGCHANVQLVTISTT